MIHSSNPAQFNRRQFLKQSGLFAASAGILATLPPSAVFAAEDNTIRLALIGCGGRGTGAVRDALSVPDAGPIKLYAMADLHDSKIEAAQQALQKNFPDKVDVSASRKFVGFDAYRHAIDHASPRRRGDVHHPRLHPARACRVCHPQRHQRLLRETVCALIRAACTGCCASVEEAEKKGVKIAAGLQCRHSPARQALIEKIRNGEMGDIPLIRANRLGDADWLDHAGREVQRPARASSSSAARTCIGSAPATWWTTSFTR